MALIYKLAAALAPKMKSDYKIAQLYEGLSAQWTAKAKISDAQASRSKEVKSDDLRDVRMVN
jgi:hypothetical protein